MSCVSSISKTDLKSKSEDVGYFRGEGGARRKTKGAGQAKEIKNKHPTQPATVLYDGVDELQYLTTAK